MSLIDNLHGDSSNITNNLAISSKVVQNINQDLSY